MLLTPPDYQRANEAYRALVCFHALPQTIQDALTYWVRHAYQYANTPHVISGGYFIMARAVLEGVGAPHYGEVNDLAFNGAMLAAQHVPAGSRWDLGEAARFHAKLNHTWLTHSAGSDVLIKGRAEAAEMRRLLAAITPEDDAAAKRVMYH